MQIDAFRQWQNTFRRDAKKDGLTVLRNHLHRVGLPDEPEKLLDGTIMYMSACCALSENEIAEIEKAITYDIRFDYTEDEVNFWIDQDAIDGLLLVYLQDVVHDEDEETK
jgi:hypothetical protein